MEYLQDVDTTNRYTILVPSKDYAFWTPRSPRFTLKAADFANYSFGEQILFKQFLDNLHADLVHFCMPQQPILYKGNHVTTVHDLTLLKTYNTDKSWVIFHAKQLVGKFVFKHVGRSSCHIITPSEYTKNEFVKFASISSDKVTVTYEAADVFHDTLQPYAHPFKQYILYVGQQSDYKNIKRLAAAHQQLLKTYPDLGLILVGKKNNAIRANETYFASKQYKNILFTDYIPDQQRDWLYTNASAYVFPSLMEGFGLPGLEAMGYGAPVVSSNATCLPEVYGEAAHYFDPTNVDDMTRAINDVLSNKSLRNGLIARGYEQLKKYSWRRMAEQTHAIYMESLNEK